MYWLIFMCFAAMLIGALSVKSQRAAKERFMAQRPGDDYGSRISQEVRQHLREGRRIRALRQFRKETGLGLRDAKEILDNATAQALDGQ